MRINIKIINKEFFFCFTNLKLQCIIVKNARKINIKQFILKAITIYST